MLQELEDWANAAPPGEGRGWSLYRRTMPDSEDERFALHVRRVFESHGNVTVLCGDNAGIETLASSAALAVAKAVPLLLDESKWEHFGRNFPSFLKRT